MRIVVLGAGVVGVTSAYELARAGHEVTVVDRQPAAALETSFANAGEISPGYASPWAAPGIPAKALRWMFMKHAPLVIRPRLDAAQVRFLLAILRNCTPAAYAQNKGRMVRLAEYSRDCLTDLRATTGLAFDERQQGTLQLFRSQKQSTPPRATSRCCAQAGCRSSFWMPTAVSPPSRVCGPRATGSRAGCA